MVITDGDIFDFMLSDENNNKHYYSIMTDNEDKAIKIAAQWFKDKYNCDYTNITMNVSGYPHSKNY